MDLLLTGLRRLSVGLTYLGGVAITLMVGVIVVDIVGRHAFGFSVRGAYDFITIALVVAVYAGMSEAFRQKAHITVDLIDGLKNPLIRDVARVVALLASFIMLVMVSWLCFGRGMDSFRMGDVTADLRIPKAWVWACILVGLGVTSITLLELFLRSAASLLRGERELNPQREGIQE